MSRALYVVPEDSSNALGGAAMSLEQFHKYLLVAPNQKAQAASRLRHLEWLQTFIGKDVLEMSTFDLQRFLDERMSAKEPSYQRTIRASFSKFYTFAFERRFIDSNPAIGLRSIPHRPTDAAGEAELAAKRKERGERVKKMALPYSISDDSPKYLKDYLEYQNARGSAYRTSYTRIRHLQMLQEFTGKDLLKITPNEIDKFLVQCLAGVSASYRKSARASLTLFYAFAVRRHYLTTDPAAEMPLIRAPRGLPRPVPEDFLQFAYSLSSDEGRAAISLAAMGGLRLSEIANAHMDHRDGNRLIVKGKGGVTRSIPINAILMENLLALEKNFVGYYFQNPFTRQQRSIGYVAKIITKHLPEGYTAHTLRHRAASVAYQSTKDLRAIQQFLGHADVSTTQIYTAVANDALSQVGEATAIGFSVAS